MSKLKECFYCVDKGLLADFLINSLFHQMLFKIGQTRNQFCCTSEVCSMLWLPNLLLDQSQNLLMGISPSEANSQRTGYPPLLAQYRGQSTVKLSRELSRAATILNTPSNTSRKLTIHPNQFDLLPLQEPQWGRHPYNTRHPQALWVKTMQSLNSRNTV